MTERPEFVEVTSMAELRSLPEYSVIRTRHGEITQIWFHQRRVAYPTSKTTGAYGTRVTVEGSEFGDRAAFDIEEADLPALLLWRPDWA